MRKTTILDIAKACGVSKTAVSLALNGKQTSIGISPSTLERILKTAEELGYRRDENAANLGRRNRRKASFAILAPWSGGGESFFMSEVFRAAAQFQGRAHFEHVMYEPGTLKGVLEGRRLKAYDKLFLCGTTSAEDAYLETRADAARAVMLNRSVKGLPCFCCDNFHGGRMLGELCLEGERYSRFVFLAPKDKSFAVQERIRGVKSAVTKASKALEALEQKPDLLPALRELISARVPTALFLPLDSHAAKAEGLLLREGVSIPAEFGVCGFDREPVSEFMSPRLSTVDSGIFQMAASAFEACESGALEPGLRLSKAELVRGESACQANPSPIKHRN